MPDSPYVIRAARASCARWSKLLASAALPLALRGAGQPRRDREIRPALPSVGDRDAATFVTAAVAAALPSYFENVRSNE
jgi:hypothetical protein